MLTIDKITEIIKQQLVEKLGEIFADIELLEPTTKFSGKSTSLFFALFY